MKLRAGADRHPPAVVFGPSRPLPSQRTCYNEGVQLAAWVSLVLVLGACSRTDRPAPTPAPAQSDAAPTPADAPAPVRSEEQARFDEERRPDLLVKALALAPGQRVADIGAGSGLLTIHLARAVAPGGKVIATDIENAVLDLLRSRIERAGLQELVEPRLVEPDAPGLEPQSYDVILLAEVDHYLSDPAAWLIAAKAALRPQGAIAITNRIHHRARSLEAAKQAKLLLVTESSPVPNTFLAVFRPSPATPSP